MASPNQPKGPFLGFQGDITPGGILEFLDIGTNVPKTVYGDAALTVDLGNLVQLGSDGRTVEAISGTVQVFYGVGDYTVRQYELIDASIPSPVFPDDYNFVVQWDDEGLPDTTSTEASIITVETIQELTDQVDPNVNAFVDVLGYYNGDDNIDTRTYQWDEFSVASPDGGSVIASTLVGTGRWILKTSSDVIDVRWFGAIPDSGVDCNSAITSACSFAVNSNNVKPITVYFPQGTYTVVPGGVSTVATVKIDELAEFYCRLVGDYFISLLDKYELQNKSTKIQQATSIGNVYLDLSSSPFGKEFDQPVNATIYESLDDALKYSGTNPILINVATPLTLSQNHDNKYIIFTSTGAISSISGVYTLTLDKVVTDNDRYTRFQFTGANPINLAVTSNVDVISGWFGTNSDTFYHVAKNASRVYINQDMTVSLGFAMNLSTIDLLVGDGGYLKLANGDTLDLPVDVRGRVVEFIGNDDTVTVTYASSPFRPEFFLLNSGHAVRQYVRLAKLNQVVVDFKGEVFNFDVDFTDLGDLDIADATFNAAVSLNNTLITDNVRVYGSFPFVNSSKSIIATGSIFDVSDSSFSGVTLSLTNSIYKADASSSINVSTLVVINSELSHLTGNVQGTDRVEIRNSNITIGPNPGATNSNTLSSYDTDIRNSTLNGFKVVAFMNATRAVKLRFYDNVCNGTKVGPEGLVGGVDTILIERNEFNNAYSLGYYYPITHDSFSPDDANFNAIHIANNLPAITSVDLAWDQSINYPNKPNSGTWVAQTDVIFKWVAPIPNGGSATFNIPTNVTFQDVFWTPSELLVLGQVGQTGVDVGTPVHRASCDFGYFDVFSGTPLCYIDDWASNTNKGNPAQTGAQYEGLFTHFADGSLGNGNDCRFQFHVDFFKH